MIRTAVVVGSTRPGRRADQVARWVTDSATARTGDSSTGPRARGMEFEIVDLADVGLPLLDEPVPAAVGAYEHEHTHEWSRLVASFDAFVFVVPEYNHGAPAVVKNAIDYLYAEWHDKAAGFVTYGLTGGVRAAEQLRLVLAEVKLACVRSHVALSLRGDFTIEDMSLPGAFTPGEHHLPLLHRMLDELADWAGALQQLRAGATNPATAGR